MRSIRLFWQLMLFGLVLLPGTPSFAQDLTLRQSTLAETAESPNVIVVPAGTRLSLQMVNAISARGAKPGHPVFFETLVPITPEGQIVIPAGSFVYGEVVAARRAGRLKGRSEVRVRLDRLVLPNGYSVLFNALPVNAAPGQHTEVQENGTLRADSAHVQDLVLVLAVGTSGVLAGSTIGMLTGGERGASLGAALGAGAGVLAALLARGPELEIPRGSTFDVVLNRRLELDASRIQFTVVGQPSSLPGPANRRHQGIFPVLPLR